MFRGNRFVNTSSMWRCSIYESCCKTLAISVPENVFFVALLLSEILILQTRTGWFSQWWFLENGDAQYFKYHHWENADVNMIQQHKNQYIINWYWASAVIVNMNPYGPNLQYDMASSLKCCVWKFVHLQSLKARAQIVHISFCSEFSRNGNCCKNSRCDV